MIKVAFLDKEIQEFVELILEHSHRFVRVKALILLLKSLGVSTRETARILGICENTVCNHLKKFSQERMSSVTTIKFYRPKSRLQFFESIIKRYLMEKRPENIKQACMEIEKLTKTNIKQTQLKNYLKSVDWSFSGF